MKTDLTNYFFANEESKDQVFIFLNLRLHVFLSQVSFGCSCDAQKFSFLSIHHAPAGSPLALLPCRLQFGTPLKVNFRAQGPHKTPSNFTSDAKETRIWYDEFQRLTLKD